MASKERTRHTLSLLLSLGVAGASAVLASAHANPSPASHVSTAGVAERLAAVRTAVAPMTLDDPALSDEDRMLLAQWVNIGGGGLGWRNGGWGNGGWRNGGWGNGGWHNGGWGNGGWHNAWGNGGWHNWGNGGWHNFWHNS